MKGKIIKGIAGFYYVHIDQKGIYECKAKGAFRNKKIKPLVGDDVEMDLVDENKKTGNIIEILPRRNELLRPASANVDQAMIIFAATKPEPNFGLLDRFVLMMQEQEIDVIICFNKCDLADTKMIERLKSIYQKSGCNVIMASVLEENGLDDIRKLLEGKTTVMAGPSGVGKSSMTNALYPDAEMATGAVSEKIYRGKHTTRHSEIFSIGHDTYLVDTPGFSTLYLEDWEKEDLKFYYKEFQPFFEACRFNGCNHMSEPDCAVKAAVKNGQINHERYQTYTELFSELANKRRY